MENTIENKSRFFAQYWGQEVLHTNIYKAIKKCTPFFWTKNKHCYLELKPLSQITNEDARQVAKYAHQLQNGWQVVKRTDGEYGSIHMEREGTINNLFHVSIQFFTGEVIANHHFLEQKNDKAQSFKVNIGKIEFTESSPVPFYVIVDFLRKRGYAVPYDGIPVKKLVEMGWVKLKEVNNGEE